MKTLKFVALSLLLLSGIIGLAAQSGYVYNYHNSFYDNMAARSIFLCPDNSVVVFSNWDNQDEINFSGSTIIKLNPNGNLLWEISFEAYGAYSTFTGIDVDADDNLIFIYEDDGEIGFYMMSSDGTISAIGPSISPSQLVTFNKALRTSRGDIVAIGRIGGWFFDYTSPKAACYYRFSAQGDKLATAYWPSSDPYYPYYRAAAHDLALMDNGNLLITCTLSSEYNTIFEVNLDGEIINRYDIPSVSDWSYGLTICKEADSESHIVAYSTADSVSINRLSDGGLEHLFSISRDRTDYISSMIVKPDYIILGGTGGIVMKLDWNGNILWWWLHEGDNSSHYNGLGVQSKSLLAVDDSDCVYWTWGSHYSQVIVKLLPNGQVANQDEVQVPAANLLTAYPNPMKDHLAIKADPSLRDDSLDIYNLKGQLVRRLKVTEGETSWDGKDSSGSDCPSGVYPK
ncbi:MAG TPA: hypothetical protein PL126_05440 [Candidatus Cloacimonadota bacterium]|nr:hypothetical protein [Candidatus Cloacimonadota bacterium]